MFFFVVVVCFGEQVNGLCANREHHGGGEPNPPVGWLAKMWEIRGVASSQDWYHKDKKDVGRMILEKGQDKKCIIIIIKSSVFAFR